jgi:transposase
VRAWSPVSGSPRSQMRVASLGTLHRWKNQALIDAGLRPATKSIEVDELAQARRTIEELEAELEAVKAASALFNGEEPVSPKAGARLPRH